MVRQRIFVRLFLSSRIRSLPMCLLDCFYSASTSWVLSYSGGLLSSLCFLLDGTLSSPASWSRVRSSCFWYSSTTPLLSVLSVVPVMLQKSLFCRVFADVVLSTSSSWDHTIRAHSAWPDFLRFPEPNLSEGRVNERTAYRVSLIMLLQTLADRVALWFVDRDWLQ